MATVSLWSGVAVAVQSALAAADTITGITKANPGVVTSAGHGMSNGTYVVLEVQGMHQLDGRVFRIANVATDTFELEGENTTLYDTFASGSAEAVTFGITMTTAMGLAASGGNFEFIDTTTIHQTVRSQIPGPASPASYEFENIWDVSDAALVALKAASDVKGLRAIRFVFSNGQIVVFNGYIGATLLPIGNAQDVVKSPVTVTMHGRPTVYSA